MTDYVNTIPAADEPAYPGDEDLERRIRHLIRWNAALRRHIDPHEPIAVIGGTAETIRALRARFALADIRWHDAPKGLRTNPEARAACIEFLVHNPALYIFQELFS